MNPTPTAIPIPPALRDALQGGYTTIFPRGTFTILQQPATCPRCGAIRALFVGLTGDGVACFQCIAPREVARHEGTDSERGR